MRVPRLNERGQRFMLIGDADSPNYILTQAVADSPFEAIREVLPYFEEHVEFSGKLTIIVIRDEYEPDEPEGDIGG